MDNGASSYRRFLDGDDYAIGEIIKNTDKIPVNTSYSDNFLTKTDFSELIIKILDEQLVLCYNY